MIRCKKSYSDHFFQCRNSTIMKPTSELGNLAFRIWLILLCQSREFNPNEIWLARTLGVSCSTIERGVRELRSKGYIQIFQGWVEDNGKKTTRWAVFETPVRHDEEGRL